MYHFWWLSPTLPAQSISIWCPGNTPATMSLNAWKYNCLLTPLSSAGHSDSRRLGLVNGISPAKKWKLNLGARSITDANSRQERAWACPTHTSPAPEMCGTMYRRGWSPLNTLWVGEVQYPQYYSRPPCWVAKLHQLLSSFNMKRSLMVAKGVCLCEENSTVFSLSLK